MSGKHRGGWSRLSGSTKRKIEAMIAAGWKPYAERTHLLTQRVTPTKEA